MGIAYIFISHDLSVVKHIADRVGVMYLGNMMEMADTESLYAKPLHPYTQALFSAIPRIGKERIEDKQILGGDVPSQPTHQKDVVSVQDVRKQWIFVKQRDPILKK